MKNTWHDSQPRSNRRTFAPKWNNDVILWIIDRINQMNEFVDMQYHLVKNEKVSLATAANWIEMARRVDNDMKNGLSFEDALTRDKERRNQLRRSKKQVV